MSLSADERETIVRMNDADDLANVWTAQRPVITKLRKNPAAELLREGKHDGSAWAEFELPKNLVSFGVRCPSGSYPRRASGEIRAFESRKELCGFQQRRGNAGRDGAADGQERREAEKPLQDMSFNLRLANSRERSYGLSRQVNAPAAWQGSGAGHRR